MFESLSVDWPETLTSPPLPPGAVAKLRKATISFVIFTYYKKYVDDILIIFDQNKTDGKTIMNHMNNIDKHLEFKLSEEENIAINYLDLSIHRNTDNIGIGIYRKPTHTDVTIQFSSNHLDQHKLAAFNVLHKQNVNTANHKTS